MHCHSFETPLLHLTAREFPLGRLQRWMLNQTERLGPISARCHAHKYNLYSSDFTKDLNLAEVSASLHIPTDAREIFRTGSKHRTRYNWIKMNMDKREPHSSKTTPDNHQSWHILSAPHLLGILKHHHEKAAFRREQGNASPAGRSR